MENMNSGSIVNGVDIFNDSVAMNSIGMEMRLVNNVKLKNDSCE